MRTATTRPEMVICPELEGRQTVVIGQVVFIAQQGSAAANRKLAESALAQALRPRKS